MNKRGKSLILVTKSHRRLANFTNEHNELVLPSTSGKPTPPPRRDSIPMLELNVTQQTIQETVKDMDRQGSKLRRYKKYLQKQAAEDQKEFYNNKKKKL